MDLNIITGYPTWYILLCILAGILGSMILYFRENKSEFPKWLKRVLGFTRFLAISLISFLLLSPLLKLSSHTLEKPVIVFAQDNSMSMVLNKDSAYFTNEYLTTLNQSLEQLGEDYDVVLSTYGDEVKLMESGTFDTLTFDEKESELSAIFDMMNVSFVNRNIGALIVAGDGIYNKGYNPVYRAAGEAYPIYTLALGDTSAIRDAYFKRVLHNSIAFAENEHPVELIVNAGMMDGTIMTLKVSEGGELIHTENIPVSGNNFSQTILLQLPSGDEGLHHYKLSISSSVEEVTYENNAYDLFVEVLKAKQKVLIVANSPHPDISAIKMAVSSNINYEVEDVLLKDFNASLDAYSLVILHQLPSFSPLSSSFMRRIGQAEVPVLYVLGGQSDIRRFRSLKTGVQLNLIGQDRVNEVLPVLNESFSVFGISQEMADMIQFFPPLDVPFARYTPTNSARILFTQKFAEVISPDPLWVFDDGAGIKSGLIAGTGIWKWRLKSWMISGNHEHFDALINKSVQYLAVKDDKRRFRVSSRQSIPENEIVVLQAELYNESFEPINEPDVEITLVDEEENEFQYVFSRSGDVYTLKAAGLDVGSYTYRASTKSGDQLFTDEGGFVVRPVIKEQTRLVADHGMMKELAESKNGIMLGKDQIGSIYEVLSERNDMKPVLHAERKYIDFINLWWVLIVLAGLLGIEWFLRKWGGSY